MDVIAPADILADLAIQHVRDATAAPARRLLYATSGRIWHRLPVDGPAFEPRSPALCGFAPARSWWVVEFEPTDADPMLCDRCAPAAGAP